MPVTYVICAAGEGTRFQQHFGTLPKALIKMSGRTLLEWSLQALPVFSDDRLVIITQSKHRVREKMEKTIANLYPFSSVVWHEIGHATRGQLETALLAKPYTLPKSSLVIYNCDTYFQSRNLLKLMQNSTIDGIIPCAQAKGESWSFCHIDSKNNVIAVKEKQRISSWASVGFYYFKDNVVFFELAQSTLDSAFAGECYVAPLYQRYIESGKKIVIDKIWLFKPMGTPEQVEEFWNISIRKLSAENTSPVLVIDLDNTITIEEPGVPYPEKTPNLAVIEKMREFHAAGWEIIIYTSRRMQTFSNDEARIVADIGNITLDWLKNHNVPFDGLRFGKPYAHNGFYVDDKAMLPGEFLKMIP